MSDVQRPEPLTEQTIRVVSTHHELLPTPPLTEEELVAMMKRGPDAEEVGRLIADLRAARARVKELEAELQEANTRPVIRGW